MLNPKVDDQLETEMAEAKNGAEIEDALEAWMLRAVERDREMDTRVNDPLPSDE